MPFASILLLLTVQWQPSPLRSNMLNCCVHRPLETRKCKFLSPFFFLLAISNMQAGKVLGKTSLGTTNKGQHFIQMGDLLFPDILDLQVLQKAGSPENSFPSHASIHWCELGFNTLSVPCIFLLGNSSLK